MLKLVVMINGITAVVLTKNEESKIEDCINGLLWCDEVIIIDDNSSDKTLLKAKKLRVKIYNRSLNSNFSEQRNFGVDKASNTWILFIDADESISDKLQEEIKYKIKNSVNVSGYLIPRIDFMWEKKLMHGEVGNLKLLRLAKKDYGRWEGDVHEEWKVRGKIKKIDSPILHYPHQSITEFLKEINYYTDIRAQELYEKKVKVYFFSIVVYPKVKFFINYILKMGFLDGVPGLLVAILMSFHSFLVRGKLWVLWQRET